MLQRIIGVMMIIAVFAGCSTVSDFLGEPKIEFSDVAIEALDLEGVTFRCDYIVTNPYPVGIKVGRIATDVIYEDAVLFNLESDEGLKLSAGVSNENSVLFKLSYESILELAGSARDKESLPFTLDGEASFDISSIPYLDKKSLTIPFRKNFEVPVFKPEFKITGGRVQLPSVKEVAKALITGGLNILRAGVVAGQIVMGKSISEDVFEGVDLDVSILFDLEVNNRGGASWALDLYECSIDTGVGALMEMKPQNGSGFIDGAGGVIQMEAVVNTLESGAFIVGLAGGSSTGSSINIKSSLSFPNLPYELELPLNIEQELSLDAFKFSSR